MSAEFAGTLTERIVIEKPVGTRTAMGRQDAGWARVCRCLAAVSSDSVGPEAEAMSLSAMPRFKVTIRNREGVAVDQRVVWRGRTLTVRQIIADPRLRDRLTLRCEEGRGQ